MATGQPGCDTCGKSASKDLFSQNQRKRLKDGKTALCLACLPTPTAEAKAAQQAAELTSFHLTTSRGAMDGVQRTENGRKRKARKPSEHMKEKAALLFAELASIYNVKQFNYEAAAARQAATLKAALNGCGDQLSATGLRLSAELQALEDAQTRLAKLTWIQLQASWAVAELQHGDFMSTLRDGAHGCRERVRRSP